MRIGFARRIVASLAALLVLAQAGLASAQAGIYIKDANSLTFIEGALLDGGVWYPENVCTLAVAGAHVLCKGNGSGDLGVTIDGGAVPADVLATGSINSATSNAAYTVNLANGEATTAFRITGLTASGATLTVETSTDGGTNWYSSAEIQSGNTMVATITADGQYRFDTAARTNIRLRVSVTGTGTISVASDAQSATGDVIIKGALPPFASGVTLPDDTAGDFAATRTNTSTTATEIGATSSPAAGSVNAQLASTVTNTSNTATNTSNTATNTSTTATEIGATSSPAAGSVNAQLASTVTNTSNTATNTSSTASEIGATSSPAAGSVNAQLASTVTNTSSTASEIGATSSPAAGSVNAQLASTVTNTSSTATNTSTTATNTGTVAGAVSGSAMKTKLAPTSTAADGITPVVGGSASSSLVLKASAGNLYGVYVTTTAAGWLMVFNATSAPADGATTAGTASGNLVECIAVPSGVTTGLSFAGQPPEVYSVGIVAVFSSTACATKTASAVALFHGAVQ